MELKIQENAENVLVVMAGSFDTLAAQQAEPQIQQLEGMAANGLVVDCNGLEYVASSGLRALLRLRKAAAAKGQQVKLLGVKDHIMEVLKVTHFDKMFVIE